MKKFKIIFYLLILAIVAGCFSSGPTLRGQGIDQVPMYGGMDRKSVPELKVADEKLIADVSNEYGGKEKGSQAFVDQGVRFYRADNLSMAMKRFNQAWLLNPDNPEVFWGFAMVYHDEGKNCDAKEMIDQSIKLKLANPVALADAGRIYTLCAVSNSSSDEKQKEQLLETSEELYRKAQTISQDDGYIYGSWATAYFWRGDYTKSWEMVRKAQKLGFTFPYQFLNMLQQKMPEPSAR